MNSAIQVVGMNRPFVTHGQVHHTSSTGAALKKELLRKCIHLLIAIVPTLAALSTQTAFLLVGFGTLFYTAAELMRVNGRRVVLISAITEFASRERDQGRIVLGPVTLGLGAMAALYFYPEPAAALAIYALAFGDGLSSLFGKLFGSTALPFFPDKTVTGSITCFTAVLFVSYGVIGSIPKAFAVAAAATVIEMLPLRDLDNLVIPIGTGLVAVLVIPL